MYAWKEVEYSIPLGMIFRKMYCHKCGEKLIKNKYVRIILKDDPKYKIYKRGRFGEGKVTQYKYNYKCPKCFYNIEYKEQKRIAKIQKQNNSFVLTNDQLKALEKV